MHQVPIFEVIVGNADAPTAHYKIYENGRIEGFDNQHPGQTCIVINRVPMYVQTQLEFAMPAEDL